MASWNLTAFWKVCPLAIIVVSKQRESSGLTSDSTHLWEKLSDWILVESYDVSIEAGIVVVPQVEAGSTKSEVFIAAGSLHGKQNHTTHYYDKSYFV